MQVWILMSLKPWGGSVVLIRGQTLPRICMVQFHDYEQSWGTASIQKKWRKDKELGNKMGEKGLDIQVHTSPRTVWDTSQWPVSEFISQWFSRGGLPTSSISITWELKKTENSQVHLGPTESETSGFGARVCCQKALQEILTPSEVYGDPWEKLNGWGGGG